MSRSSIAPKIAASKLFRGSSQGSDLLVGRDEELKALDAAWSGPDKKNVITIVAWGGVGKTSLVARWAANTLAKENHGGIARYFDWSFYSQGARAEGDATGADKAASADIFVKVALDFFGDPALAAGNAGAWQKGERLAHLVADHRTLLVLDGLEPLQDVKSGELLDEALRALLRGLAADNQGLCVVTTRQQLPELNTYHTTTSPEWQLAKLSKLAGAELLKKLGVRGTTAEREQLGEDVKGHALTLTLLGKYLAEAHGGDIRKRDVVSLSEADYEETSGHAFHVMEAYERWLEKDESRELAILRLLGLFDRPATPDCLTALRQAPVIPGLTDALIAMTDAQWNVAVKRIAQLGLVEEQPWEFRRIFGYGEELARKAMEAGKKNISSPLGDPRPFSLNDGTSVFNSIEAHPLIREYFGRNLRVTAPEAWRALHSHLFEHLQASVPYWPEGLDGLQPLYQAVAHGCRGGLYSEAFQVYSQRILRGTSGPWSFYSSNKLGARSADLAANSCFFVTPWTRPVAELPETYQAWLFNDAAYNLRALGRLTEAREAQAENLKLRTKGNEVEHLPSSIGNLGELDLTLGDVASAIRESAESVTFADSGGKAMERATKRATHAHALHQAGKVEEAQRVFGEAEAIHRENQPAFPLLYSLPGFCFCDLLLAGAEREAWRTLMTYRILPALPAQELAPLPVSSDRSDDGEPPQFKALRVVEERSQKMFEWRNPGDSILDIAVDHLTLGRATVYRAILDRLPTMRAADLPSHLDEAVHGFRLSGQLDFVPHALLTRSCLRAFLGQPAEARTDLDESQQIAERGPMRLHLADIHLHRARLFFRDDLKAAREDLKQARILIEKCGYLRRIPELEDAEKVIFAAK